MKHIVTLDGWTRDQVNALMERAKEMQHMSTRDAMNVLKGRILGLLFYEASTRTSCSFQAAMLRLGGQVICVSTESSSVKKGESLEDSVRCMGCYCDALVIRHFEHGAAARAAAALDGVCPVLNAGDGTGQHPTQALLDVFTIMNELPSRPIESLHITLLGDLKHGRTVHSLAKLLSLYAGIELAFVSPSSLRMPESVMQFLEQAGVREQVREYDSLDEVLTTTDVLYVTRVQRERFTDESEYLRVKDAFIIGPEHLSLAKSTMVLMHPLPRLNEIKTECDDDPRASYFRQMKYGMYVRMAILESTICDLP